MTESHTIDDQLREQIEDRLEAAERRIEFLRGGLNRNAPEWASLGVELAIQELQRADDLIPPATSPSFELKTRWWRRFWGALRGRAPWCKDFGPREDEGGEGVKPVDPLDGDAIGEASPNTGTPPARSKPPASTSPDAEVQEGAESSRVGGPSDIATLRDLLADTQALQNIEPDSLYLQGKLAGIRDAITACSDGSES